MYGANMIDKPTDGLACFLSVSLSNIIIQNSVTNENIETSTLVGICGLNVNQKKNYSKINYGQSQYQSKW